MMFLLRWLIEAFSPDPNLVDTISQFGPQLCQRLLVSGPFLELDAALVCGVRLPPGFYKQALIDTGLIHLIVVSGSHLAFLASGLAPLPRRVQYLVLGLYCFMVGFQAPVVRALLHRLLLHSIKQRIGVTALQLEACTILVALLIYPPWLMSRSFMMSWMCALAFQSPQVIRPRLLDVSVKSYLFLLPFCWSAPLSILWNCALTPLIGGVLFPVRLLTTLLHVISPLTDWLWHALGFVLQHGPKAPQLSLFIDTGALLLLPIVVHSLLLLLEVKWRKTIAFESSAS